MGGPGGATNPEQLFAAGYAACFHSALQLVAGQAKADTTDSEVVGRRLDRRERRRRRSASPSSSRSPCPPSEQAVAEELVEQAHQVCPYSNATRGNVEVTLTVV